MPKTKKRVPELEPADERCYQFGLVNGASFTIYTSEKDMTKLLDLIQDDLEYLLED